MLTNQSALVPETHKVLKAFFSSPKITDFPQKGLHVTYFCRTRVGEDWIIPSDDKQRAFTVPVSYGDLIFCDALLDASLYYEL